jgi:hypothetical protein
MPLPSWGKSSNKQTMRAPEQFLASGARDAGILFHKFLFGAAFGLEPIQ